MQKGKEFAAVMRAAEPLDDGVGEGLQGLVKALESWSIVEGLRGDV